MRQLLALVKEPEKKPRQVMIHDDLAELQGIVDGYIEIVHLWDGTVMIVNEEGKIRNLPPNFKFNGDIIRGTALFIGSDPPEMCDLGFGDMALLMELLKVWEKRRSRWMVREDNGDFCVFRLQDTDKPDAPGNREIWSVFRDVEDAAACAAALNM